MRLDRFVTLGVVAPLRRLLSGRAAGTAPRAGHRRLPILMYHSISADPEPGTAAYYRTATTPDRFAQQMRVLRENGWRGVSLREALTAEPGVERLAALTFDDGFRDFHSAALPILREFDFGATLFLATGFIAADGSRRQFRGRDCLAWSEIEEWSEERIELGSHTRSHPALTELPWSRVESELADSKAEIEDRLGRAVTSFSYPFAYPQADEDFCARLGDALERLGYEAGVTTAIGCAPARGDPFRLPRLPVNEADDPEFLTAKLDGSYDWLAGPQRACKVLRDTF